MEIPDVGELFDFPAIWEISIAGINISINRVVLLLFVTTLITTLLFYTAFRKPKMVPKKLQSVMEALVEFIRSGIAREVIGPDGDKYVPFLTCLFSFIFVLNFFEVAPGVSFPPASRMAVPLALSLIVYVLFNAIGFSRGPLKYVGGVLFPPGVPKPLYILVTPIELVSTFIIRPVSLAVRLFANMMAGHILLAIFFFTTYAVVTPLRPTSVLGIIPLALSIVFVAFEVFVGFLQAYIFTILSAVYIGDALHPAH